jgi:hypothetical protein
LVPDGCRFQSEDFGVTAVEALLLVLVESLEVDDVEGVDDDESEGADELALVEL